MKEVVKKEWKRKNGKDERKEGEGKAQMGFFEEQSLLSNCYSTVPMLVRGVSGRRGTVRYPVRWVSLRALTN